MATSRLHAADGTDASAIQNSDGTLGARFDAFGRRRAGTTPKPAIVVGAGAGAGATAAVTRGTDSHGTVTVVSAGSPAAGTLATLTFASPWSSTPVCVSVDGGDAISAAVQLYATVSTTTLVIKFAGTLAAAQTLTIFYEVVGGA